jgi:hypothetical protein
VARRRFISEELLTDPDLACLPDSTQLFFIKMLAISDDFGFVPFEVYRLAKLLGVSDRRRTRVVQWMGEILQAKLGRLVRRGDDYFFMFKPETFDRIQAYLLNNRTQSEYLNLKVPEADKVRREAQLQEIPEGSGIFSPAKVESREKNLSSLVLSSLQNLRQLRHVASLHDEAEQQLLELGMTVTREYAVTMPDGSTGRVDLFAEKDGQQFAIELDSALPRSKSLLKVSQFDKAIKIVVLRCPTSTITTWPGLDHVICLGSQTRRERSWLTAEDVPIPSTLDATKGFKEAWNEWLDFRRTEIKKKVGPKAAKTQLSFLARQPDPIACIEQSIQNSYQGIFVLKTQGGQRGRITKAGGATTIDDVKRRIALDEARRREQAQG